MAKSKWFEDVQLFRTKRKQLRVTQHQLAKMSKVGYAVIASIEAGRRKLTNDEVGEALWKALAHVENGRRKERVFSLLLGPKDTTPQARMEWEAEFARLRDDKRREEISERLIEAQHQHIRILQGLVSAHQDLSSEQNAKIRDLERRIAELRDLLGLETEVAVLREKVQEPD